jgi:peptidoglycan/LPS O-acetylase OafA/YrhL
MASLMSLPAYLWLIGTFIPNFAGMGYLIARRRVVWPALLGALVLGLAIALAGAWQTGHDYLWRTVRLQAGAILGALVLLWRDYRRHGKAES